jgi:predicted DNA-binding transcriptional regulator AlpA
MSDRRLLTLPEAAALVPFSVDTLRRAVNATSPDTFPPPLRGKKDSKGRYLIRSVDLDAWIDSLPDA